MNQKLFSAAVISSLITLTGFAPAAAPNLNQIGTYTGKGSVTFYYPNTAKSAKVQSNITVIVFQSGEVRLQLPPAPGTQDPIVMNVIGFFDATSGYLSNSFSSTKTMAGSITFTQSGASTSAFLNATLTDRNAIFIGYDIEGKKLTKVQVEKE